MTNICEYTTTFLNWCYLLTRNVKGNTNCKRRCKNQSSVSQHLEGTEGSRQLNRAKRRRREEARDGLFLQFIIILKERRPESNVFPVGHLFVQDFRRIFFLQVNVLSKSEESSSLSSRKNQGRLEGSRTDDLSEVNEGNSSSFVVERKNEGQRRAEKNLNTRRSREKRRESEAGKKELLLQSRSQRRP